MIGGVDVPTSGKVYLDGQDVYAQNNEKLAIFRRRQVGLIYQFHNLIPTLNVVENITLPVLMDKRKVNQERLSELLRAFRTEPAKKSFTKSIVRWSTAAGLSWASLNECSSSFVGG